MANKEANRILLSTIQFPERKKKKKNELSRPKYEISEL